MNRWKSFFVAVGALGPGTFHVRDHAAARIEERWGVARGGGARTIAALLRDAVVIDTDPSNGWRIIRLGAHPHAKYKAYPLAVLDDADHVRTILPPHATKTNRRPQKRATPPRRGTKR